MIDKETIIKTFLTNFIIKDKRERCYLELTNPKKRTNFTERLNHKWDTVLDMKYLVQVEKQFDNADKIQQLLKFKGEHLCYIISNYTEFDDKLIPFKDVFGQVYSRGFATILLNTSADKLFLDTEQEQGNSFRFIGTKQVENAFR